MIKVISGAQTGADVAGLWAAKLFGIPTGGWAPEGFITLDGPHPEMADTFGIKEHSKADYRYRTIDNLKQSTATMVCSQKMSSPGTKLTINQCKKEYVPCYTFLLDPSNLAGSIDYQKLNILAREIRSAKLLNLPFVLNVAGNATSNSPRIFEFTFKICHRLFTELGYISTVGDWEWANFQDRWK